MLANAVAFVLIVANGVITDAHTTQWTSKQRCLEMYAAWTEELQQDFPGSKTIKDDEQVLLYVDENNYRFAVCLAP